MSSGDNREAHQQQQESEHDNTIATILRQQRLLLQSLQQTGGVMVSQNEARFRSLQDGRSLQSDLGGMLDNSPSSRVAQRASHDQLPLVHAGNGGPTQRFFQPSPLDHSTGGDLLRSQKSSSSDSDSPPESKALARLLFSNSQSAVPLPSTTATTQFSEGNINFPFNQSSGHYDTSQQQGMMQATTEELFRLYNQQAMILSQQLQLQQQALAAQLSPMPPFGPLDTSQSSLSTPQASTFQQFGLNPQGMSSPSANLQSIFGSPNERSFLTSTTTKPGAAQLFNEQQALFPNAMSIPERIQRDMPTMQGAAGLGEASRFHSGHGQGDSSTAKRNRSDDSSTKPPAKPKRKRRAQRKKPPDMPRRPLSAYNLFFSEERERILQELDHQDQPERSHNDSTTLSASSTTDGQPTQSAATPSIQALLRPLVPAEKKRRPHRKTHGKITFKELARLVADRWKVLSIERRSYYQSLAEKDLVRHKEAMENYYKKQAEAKEKSAERETEDRPKQEEQVSEGDEEKEADCPKDAPKDGALEQETGENKDSSKRRR